MDRECEGKVRETKSEERKIKVLGNKYRGESYFFTTYFYMYHYTFTN